MKKIRFLWKYYRWYFLIFFDICWYFWYFLIRKKVSWWDTCKKNPTYFISFAGSRLCWQPRVVQWALRNRKICMVSGIGGHTSCTIFLCELCGVVLPTIIEISGSIPIWGISRIQEFQKVFIHIFNFRKYRISVAYLGFLRKNELFFL